MTFLLDHDTPDDLAYSLRTLNHGVVYLRNVLPLSHCGIIILIRRKSRTEERSALVRLLDHTSESGLKDNINFA